MDIDFEHLSKLLSADYYFNSVQFLHNITLSDRVIIYTVNIYGLHIIYIAFINSDILKIWTYILYNSYLLSADNNLKLLSCRPTLYYSKIACPK